MRGHKQLEQSPYDFVVGKYSEASQQKANVLGGHSCSITFLFGLRIGLWGILGIGGCSGSTTQDVALFFLAAFDMFGELQSSGCAA